MEKKLFVIMKICIRLTERLKQVKNSMAAVLSFKR